MTNKIEISIKQFIAILAVLLVFAHCDTTSKDKVMDKYSKVESSTNQSETSEITCPECGHTQKQSYYLLMYV